MAHPQEDDHTDLPLQDPGRLRGSVLGEKRDSDQQLQKEVGSNGFDVYPYITHCALDIICGE